MHWVIQNNIFNEKGIIDLFNILSQERYTFSVHRVTPFIGTIEPDINPEGPVICIGAHSLRHTAKKKGWVPGVLDLANVTLEMMKEAWGENLLNHNALVCRFADVVPPSESFFIRPESDEKLFSGTVTSKDEFNRWRDQVQLVTDIDGIPRLNADTPVIVNTPIHIYREYRFWIVKGEIATYSLYKLGSRVIYKQEADPDTIQFVKDRIKEWQPERAFVMDVALVDEGYKIIELNTLNSSGFYAAEMDKLVYSLQGLNYV